MPQVIDTVDRRLVGTIMDKMTARILRVTEDLRVIQQELNFAAIQVDDENQVVVDKKHARSLETLKSVLDQMRHFLFFYFQVMNNQSDLRETLRKALQQNAAEEAAEAPVESLDSAAGKAFLRYRLNGKKPN